MMGAYMFAHEMFKDTWMKIDYDEVIHSKISNMGEYNQVIIPPDLSHIHVILERQKEGENNSIMHCAPLVRNLTLMSSATERSAAKFKPAGLSDQTEQCLIVMNEMFARTLLIYYERNDGMITIQYSFTE